MNLDKLKDYRKKRSLEATPEPRGKIHSKISNNPKFVIQKHAASHLHYDLRLELDGVLKSWALPKGPTLDPEIKHLAVMVEDHPLDYADFEGVIPEGNYGAGTVMIWDEGNYYHPMFTDRIGIEREMRKGLDKGHISFVLSGEKLQGEFTLVKLKKSKEKNAWLLIKANDQFAGKKDFNDRSVISKKTMEEISGDAKFWFADNGKIDLNIFPKKTEPRIIDPMLATLIDQPFDDSNWLFEIKWDGYRAIAYTGYSTKLYSRNNHSLSERFPEIFSELQRIKINAIWDGEIVVLDEKGFPVFSLLQNYSKQKRGRLYYYIFDLIWLKGHDLTAAKLVERKGLLEKLLPRSDYIGISRIYEGKGRDFFETIKKQNLEGAIAKRKDSPYEPGKRSKYWLKIKTHLEQEVIIAGFTEPKSGHPVVGSLLLGVYEGENFVYIGNVGTGFDEKTINQIKQLLVPLKISSSPFRQAPKLKEPVVWTAPTLIAEIKFQEWTEDGLVRQAVFLGLRDDIAPINIHREKTKRSEELI